MEETSITLFGLSVNAKVQVLASDVVKIVDFYDETPHMMW
jgi:hypothetical protein